MADTNPAWEQATIEKLLMASLKEQRRRRRWGIFFKLIFFAYLCAVLWLFWPTEDVVSPGKEKPHVAIVDIRGEIGDTLPASADNITEGLDEAFKDKSTQAVILNINSPGGSPVQAADIYNEIRYLRNNHKDIKVYAVCSDLCASAAYYVASASDYIYASPSSLVGSIGVLMDGFGFVDSMQKLGVQRRLYTSGDHKGFLDPFSPVKPDEQILVQQLLDNVHQQFIEAVQKGRGDRLKNDPNLFSGLVWTGSQAMPLGLIDGFGNINFVARNVIKNKNLMDYTVKPNFFQQMADRLGASFAHEMGSQLGLVFKGLQ